MGEAKRKSVQTPDISVLIPSRGRPDMLARLVKSLGYHPNVDIIIGLDEDDDTHRMALDRLLELEDAGLPKSLKVIGPRPRTLAECVNDLASRATGKFLFFIGDDYVIEDERWPERILDAAAKLPKRVGVLYPRCKFHPGFANLAIISRETYQALTYYMAPFFPYWFTDTWWDEIGEIMGVKIEVDLDCILPEGKGNTHGLTEIKFWAEFFESTRPLRVRDAITLAKLAWNEMDPPFKRFAAELAARQQACAQRVAHLRSPEFIKTWEARSDSPPSDRYAAVKADAEKIMATVRANTPRRLKVAIAVPSGRTWEAGTAIDVASMMAYSALAGVDLVPINLQTSMISNSRNGTVEIALNEKVDYIMWIDSDMRFPPDTLMKLLAHDKDIVGATYNKRVPPHETLGKLAGSMPADGVHGGLHEAILLPGGMILVRALVYLTIKWPAYAEVYRWPGKDGLEGFKNLLRDYFYVQPPQDVVDSLAESKFGEWIKTNYWLGENGEPYLYFSEDLFFCRKARRAGFTIWCDIDLTHKVVHLGTLDVTCLPPKAEAETQPAPSLFGPTAPAVHAVP